MDYIKHVIRLENHFHLIEWRTTQRNYRVRVIVCTAIGDEVYLVLHQM